jgi:hypothetical protein
MHNYVSVSLDPVSIQTPQDESSRKQMETGPVSGQEPVPGMMSAPRGLFPGDNVNAPNNANLPTNSSTYNAYSVPGVMYNTGQLIVPELQRPPPQRHIKIGEDVTVDSLQQQRNSDLNNSLPFIAKQLNHIISPEISNVYPPERYGGNAGGGQGYYNAAAHQNAQKLVAHTQMQKLNSHNGAYGRQPSQQNEICYL